MEFCNGAQDSRNHKLPVDPGAYNLRKFMLVVRDFPAGCGSAPFVQPIGLENLQEHFGDKTLDSSLKNVAMAGVKCSTVRGHGQTEPKRRVSHQNSSEEGAGLEQQERTGRPVSNVHQGFTLENRQHRVGFQNAETRKKIKVLTREVVQSFDSKDQSKQNFQRSCGSNLIQIVSGNTHTKKLVPGGMERDGSPALARVVRRDFQHGKAMVSSRHTAISSSAVSTKIDAEPRKKVLESLHLFREIVTEQSRQKLSSSKDGKESIRRIDLCANKLLKQQCKYAHAGKQFRGSVPGVCVGDKFYYRIELAIVSLHRPPQGGIDWMNYHGESIATSIVASKSSADDLNNPNELVYVGQGGNSDRGKCPKDQQLVMGNLALKNSIRTQNPVRVIRKVKASIADVEIVTSISEIFIYDGLYVVQKYEKDYGPQGNMVLKFFLKRMEGQPPIDRYKG